MALMYVHRARMSLRTNRLTDLSPQAHTPIRGLTSTQVLQGCDCYRDASNKWNEEAPVDRADIFLDTPEMAGNIITATPGPTTLTTATRAAVFPTAS